MAYHRLRVPTRLGCKFSLICVGTAALVSALSAPSVSDTMFIEPVIQVEEDWQLVLNEPDDGLTTPQFHTAMSPFGHTDSLFAQVTWNYREIPDFSAGGLQMQGWHEDGVLTDRSFAYGALSRVAETVGWTQTLTADGTMGSFSITNGYSNTWSTFGYPAQNMKLHGVVNVSNLDGYNPDVSVENSGVTFGSNRVRSLRITEVRYYGASGLLAVDETPRVVFQLE